MRGSALLLTALLCSAPAVAGGGQPQAPYSTAAMRPAPGSPVLGAFDGDGGIRFVVDVGFDIGSRAALR